MTGQLAPADAGFVIIDALMAVALVAAAGTTIILIALGILHRQGEELDRSVALVMSQSLMRQYLLLGGDRRAALEASDEFFSYEFVETNSPEIGRMRQVAVIATRKSGGGGHKLRLEFLAPLNSVGNAL